MIKQLRLENFTTFKDLKVDFSPGINVLIGENGTGKTHLLKVAYALSIPGHPSGNNNPVQFLTDKLIGVFKPDDRLLRELHRKGTREQTLIHMDIHEATRDDVVELTFSIPSRRVSILSASHYQGSTVIPIFIPAKEVLSFMHGFVELYDKHDIGFDETYSDICKAIEKPDVAISDLEEKAKWALEEMEKLFGGKFVFQNKKITFKATDREVHSVNLMAEGFRKLGILYRLLENLSINPGLSGSLFWDEPESNLNPRLHKLLVETLLNLSRKGQQVLLATHDYVLLKELKLQKRESDQVMFHGLYRDKTSGNIMVQTADDYLFISHNTIADTFADLMDRDIAESMGGLGK